MYFLDPCNHILVQGVVFWCFCGGLWPSCEEIGDLFLHKACYYKVPEGYGEVYVGIIPDLFFGLWVK